MTKTPMSKEAASRIQSNSDITGKIPVLKNAHRILQIKTPANDFLSQQKGIIRISKLCLKLCSRQSGLIISKRMAISAAFTPLTSLPPASPN